MTGVLLTYPLELQQFNFSLGPNTIIIDIILSPIPVKVFIFRKQKSKSFTSVLSFEGWNWRTEPEVNHTKHFFEFPALSYWATFKLLNQTKKTRFCIHTFYLIKLLKSCDASQVKKLMECSAKRHLLIFYFWKAYETKKQTKNKEIELYWCMI